MQAASWILFSQRTAKGGGLAASAFLFAGVIGCCAVAWAQQNYPPSSSCPVVASLATAKNHDPDDQKNDTGDLIVILYSNQGRKTVRGAEFQLFLLDAAGNRYPALQRYQARGDVEPQQGDLVTFPAKDEVARFGDKWEWIEGVEVHVTKVLFKDATVWTPRKGIDCKTAFLNDYYEKEMVKRGEEISRRLKAFTKKWNREHPESKLPESDDGKQ